MYDTLRSNSIIVFRLQKNGRLLHSSMLLLCDFFPTRCENDSAQLRAVSKVFFIC